MLCADFAFWLDRKDQDLEKISSSNRKVACGSRRLDAGSHSWEELVNNSYYLWESFLAVPEMSLVPAPYLLFPVKERRATRMIRLDCID